MNDRRYTVVMDWAGVRNNRAAYFDRFGDANREAMRAASTRGKEVRVYCGADFIVSYQRGPEGRARVSAVGEPSS